MVPCMVYAPKDDAVIEFKLPELGENIRTAEVIRVLVREGDQVKAEQSVLEVESEKAAMPLPAPQAGRVTKIHVHEGDTVSVGQPLLSIDEAAPASPKDKLPSEAAKTAADGAPEARHAKRAPGPMKPEPERTKSAPSGDGEAKREAAKARPEIVPPPVDRRQREMTPSAEEVQTQADDGEGAMSIAAGPATRRLARELGVDLRQVRGTAPGGRITREDVQTAVRQRLAQPAGEAPALPNFSQWGPIERQPLSRLARTAADRLRLSWQLVPHVTQHGLADITELEADRQRLQARRPADSPKITLTAFALKAAVAALKTFPHFNGSFDAARGELILKRYYHIGVAVDTEHGLLVPVIRDADRKTVGELAAELATLADKARRRSLSAQDMQGGTFTISNLGAIGGTAFTPIINYPEVAILGISRASWQLVQREGKIDNRLMLPLSLSYDHRVINGADGARFINKLVELLAEPVALLVES